MPEIPLLVSHALDNARRWLASQGLQDLAEIKPGSIAVHLRRFGESASSELRSRVRKLEQIAEKLRPGGVSITSRPDRTHLTYRR